MMLENDQPLVSIIIRSVGRPALSEALAAVARQTYPTIEVIVVDATAGTHPDVPRVCGAFPVVLVPAASARRTRPVAANVGLDAARGDYIGFLDDDDLIDPPHVAGLVAALEASREYAVAYAYVREINQAGDVTDRRRTPYSRFLLFQDCYFVPCAMLFRSEIRTRCRFDERLDVCEDWDFWLQASRVSDFLLVPQETAVYRSELGQSGMGQGTNRDLDKFVRFRALIADKWRQEGEQLAQTVLPCLDRDYAQAEACYARGDRAAAETIARAILLHYSAHVGALTMCGTLEALRGNFAFAAMHFQRSVEVVPDNPAAHVNLAQALERLGRLDTARIHYRHVLKLDPTSQLARARLARIDSLVKANSR